MSEAFDAPIEPISAAAAGLPDYYDARALYRCSEPLRSTVDVTRRLADWERAAGRRPTVVFDNLVDRPGSRVLGNPYPRPVLLAALGLDEDRWLSRTERRLAGPAPAVTLHPDSAQWTTVDGLDRLPVVQHRPGDAGRYITAGVAVTSAPGGGRVNLGVYRIQVTGNRSGLIFMDPRTDGHRNLLLHAERGEPMPITVFLGAHPAFMMVAASRLPADGDDLAVAARLAGGPLDVVARSLPVPLSATHVITGRVSTEMAPEGPFGEFKGYYVEARMSPVLDIERVEVGRHNAPYPTILPGAESGLTLMRMQNEILMYAHLRAAGFPVRSVWYPLTARAEFLTLIECDEPSRDLLAAAMRFDVRAKVVVCARDLSQPGLTLASHGFTTITEPYRRKGVVTGDRLGMVLDLPPEGRPVEF